MQMFFWVCINNKMLQALVTERMWMVYRTVREMVQDRGYTNLLTGHAVLDRDHFATLLVSNGTIEKDDLTFSCENPKTHAILMVLFAKEDSIGIKPVVTLIEKMTIDKMRHCILVYPKSVTAPAKKHILKCKGLRIELFSEDELVINISKHKLMPKHTLLSSGAKKELLARFKETQLPRILPTDPMAKYLGTRRGDVVRIIRRSETAGQCMMFRVCL